MAEMERKQWVGSWHVVSPEGKYCSPPGGPLRPQSKPVIWGVWLFSLLYCLFSNIRNMFSISHENASMTVIVVQYCTVQCTILYIYKRNHTKGGFIFWNAVLSLLVWFSFAVNVYCTCVQCVWAGHCALYKYPYIQYRLLVSTLCHFLPLSNICGHPRQYF